MGFNQDIKKAEAEALAFFDALEGRAEPPVYEITLWPHRSMSRKGFANVMGFTCLMFLIPLFAFLGTIILWAILLPIVVTVAALWWMIERNYKDAQLREVVRLWPDLITVERHAPRQTPRYWHANPYWLSVKMRDTKEIENYLTLAGGSREIELGAFLAPEERLALRQELQAQISRLRR